jgi:hypothetical protein
MTAKTLADVAELAAGGESFDLSIRDFLDSFFADPSEESILSEPISLAAQLPGLGDVEDAYLGAVAEWLAWKFDLQPPQWAFDKRRSLHRPWFASELSTLRALLLLESPAPFRSRNLFVSENALSRA